MPPPRRREARDHGISSVGLPSRLAAFKALPLPALEASCPSGGGGGKLRGGADRPPAHASWWDLPHARPGRGGGGGSTAPPPAPASSSGAAPTAAVELCNSERGGGGGGLWGRLAGGRRGGAGAGGRGLASPVCQIELPQMKPSWAPRIQMFLPSFRCAE